MFARVGQMRNIMYGVGLGEYLVGLELWGSIGAGWSLVNL